MGKQITLETKLNNEKKKQQHWQLAIHEYKTMWIHEKIETILPVTCWSQARTETNESAIALLDLRENECMLRKRTIDLSKSESRPRAREKPSFSKSVSSKSRACVWEREHESARAREETTMHVWFFFFPYTKGNVFVVFLWITKKIVFFFCARDCDVAMPRTNDMLSVCCSLCK